MHEAIKRAQDMQTKKGDNAFSDEDDSMDLGFDDEVSNTSRTSRGRGQGRGRGRGSRSKSKSDETNDQSASGRGARGGRRGRGKSLAVVEPPSRSIKEMFSASSRESQSRG